MGAPFFFPDVRGAVDLLSRERTARMRTHMPRRMLVRTQMAMEPPDGRCRIDRLDKTFFYWRGLIAQCHACQCRIPESLGLLWGAHLFPDVRSGMFSQERTLARARVCARMHARIYTDVDGAPDGGADGVDSRRWDAAPS